VEQTDAIGIPDSYRSFVDGLLARRVVDHLQLGPLDDRSIRRLISAELGFENDAAVETDLVERAQGNPWFAKELAHAWQRGITEIPTNIAAAATTRLRSLDDVGQDIANATALCPDGAHIGWLDALTGQRPRDFVRTMERVMSSGLVREDGDIITIAHPLMQQALVDDLSLAMKRAIHLELAEVIGAAPVSTVVDARARGHHFAAAGRATDAAEHFLVAARANELGGQLHEAYIDLVHAGDVETRPAERTEILRNRAFIAQQIGNYVAASETWSDLARVAAADGDDECYAYALYQQYWTYNDGRSHERLARVASLDPSNIGWSARAAGALGRMSGDYELAIRHDERALELAAARGDRSLEALALLSIASSQADLGRMTDAIDRYRDAIDLAVRERLHAWVIKAWGSLAETLADDLQTVASLEACVDGLRYVNDLCLDRDRPAMLAWLARGYVRVGRLEEARAAVLDAVRLDGEYRSDLHSALVTGVLAEVMNEIGDRTAVESAVEEAIRTATAFGYESWIVEAEFERARMLATSDAVDDALGIVERLDSTEPVFRSKLATWSARLAVVSSNQRALQLAREFVEYEAASTGDTPAAGLAVDEARATIKLVETGDTRDLEQVAERWEAAERSLDALRSRLTLAIAMSQTDKSRAVELLREIRARFADSGASHDADLVSALLRQLGTRSRAKSRTTNVGPLTKRELEIARLVASGLKNSEVASTLFLAEKTVAAHLSNIYGKVEVRSRVQLTAWIRENDAEFEASLASA
jgi:DNA-binding CsgD family transcriptional regulator